MSAAGGSTLIERLPPARGRLAAGAPIGPLTWFRVGGPAEVLFRPADAADLAEFLAATPPDIPVTVIGVGSNLLVRDGGIRGIVVRLGRGFAAIAADGAEVTCGAGALDLNVALTAAEEGISGLEFLSGIPGTVGGGYGGLLLSRTPAGQAIVAAAGSRAMAASARLGLVVTDIEVEGRTTTDVATIIAALGAERGTPIFAVDPNRARQQLEQLPWVRSAMIERRLPHTLFVRLVERHPLAVWQHDGRQELIDSRGGVIPVKELGRFARLPTVVGADAATHAAALLAILAREPALARRVTAAIRVDDRRWNLRIDNAIDVLLPEEDEAAAWARLAALERRKKLFERDILAVDLRLPDRLVLRLANAPAKPDGKQAAPGKKAQPAAKHPGKST